ncbi:unnamed protein product [Prorocentrum cordatum]|uniref:Carboxylic ester hydrolase n=1 Tax=Prorocentrum cordatum TaxID=2364126 RepID=A0ABN9Y9G3_9DINO|nr:unnamed protein product [Polarella glacialis]
MMASGLAARATPLLHDERRSALVPRWVGRAIAAAVLASAGITLRWQFSPRVGAVRLAAEQLQAFEIADEEEVVITLPCVRVRGLESRSWGRRFRGIPYAKAGRFQNPRPLDKFPEEIDARFFSASCMRGSAQRHENVSEDCLHLNIYTPRVLVGSTITTPVVVWFHGGSFTMGAGSDTHVEDVKELVTTRHLIVVTINYRLGIFGFLGSERLRMSSNESVGNFGILDQQMALMWVKENIAYFGGNPSQVSLFGWSAGAASISNHLVMESSAGLFASAILMSGGFTDWAASSLESNERDYDAVLKATGCDAHDKCWERGPVCSCLLRLSSEQLLEAQSRLGIMWAPTVDGTHLKLHPAQALSLGAVNTGVPIVIGGTREDCLKDIGANATVADFEEFAAMPPELGGLGLSAEQAGEARRLYVDAAGAPAEHGLRRWSPAYWAARRAGADKTMLCVARRSARAWQGAAAAPAWWYVWANEPARRYPDPPAAVPGGPRRVGVGGCWPCPGATHGSDLPFLFERLAVDVDDRQADLADMYQIFFRNMARGFVGLDCLRMAEPSLPVAADVAVAFPVRGVHLRPPGRCLAAGAPAARSCASYAAWPAPGRWPPPPGKPPPRQDRDRARPSLGRRLSSRAPARARTV